LSDRHVVVIGSGPAGAMAARQLVDRGIPVLMLEAGVELPSGLLLRVGERNLIRHIPEHERIVLPRTAQDKSETVWIRNMAPGGLSNQWTGAVPRFAPEDFLEGERLHERYRWPIGYDDLRPYYEVAERVIGVSGEAKDVPNMPTGLIKYPRTLPRDWDPVVAQAESRGQGLAPLPIADGPPTVLVRRGTAFNSYSVIVESLQSSPHFKFVMGAHALELEWSAKDGRVESVLYRDKADGQEKRVAAAAVVLACGPLDSTKLLLNSTSNAFPEGIGNSNGLLGRHLHDHVRDWWVCDLARPISLLASAAYLTRRPFASSAPLMAASWTLGVANQKDRVKSRASLRSTAIGVQVFGTTIPDDRNFVKRSTTRVDAYGRPELDVRMQFDDGAISNVMGARDVLFDLLDSAGYSSSLRPTKTVLTPGEAVHFGGTVRMHESRQYGVTDKWNRVYDAPNVLVCDASCFTTGPEKNPTLTVMAIAARAADRLAHDLKH
jgi:choline dehydrogenase-like flavoprotein